MSIPSLSERSPQGRDFARIVEPGGPSHVGVVVQRIEHEPESRVLVEFGRTEAPCFSLGETVQLEFPGTADGGGTMARIVFRAETERVRRYELQVLMPPTGPREDRRHQARQPAATRVHATVRPAGSVGAVGVLVRDASFDGIALSGEPWIDGTLAGTDEVDLSVDMGPGEIPLELRGRIVYRRIEGGELRYGLAFRDNASGGIESLVRLDRFLGGEGLRQAS